MAKKKLTDLTGDGKVTQADVLKGRGVFAEGGESFSLLSRFVDFFKQEKIQEIENKAKKGNVGIGVPYSDINDTVLIQEALKGREMLSRGGETQDTENNLLSKFIKFFSEEEKQKRQDKAKQGMVGIGVPYSTIDNTVLIQEALKAQKPQTKQEQQVLEMLKQEAEINLLNKLEKKRRTAATGGNINSQMEMMLGDKTYSQEMQDELEPLPEQTSMVSDETMESDYLDFILDEALDEEEEDFLMEQLESNDKLSLIFDKVIDVATEFAGSGPVEGPGSGVSDSIPARLSDGEFVFTAKATEEIGADNLEAMMKEAEANAEGRQQVAEGGEIEEEDNVEMPVQAAQQQNIRVSRPTVSALAARQEQKDIVGDEIKKRMMLDPNQKHVRS